MDLEKSVWYEYDKGKKVTEVVIEGGKSKETTYRKPRVINGFIPILGPLYLIGCYFSLRFDKNRWERVKIERKELKDFIYQKCEEYGISL